MGILTKNSKKQVHYNRVAFGEEDEDEAQSKQQEVKKVDKSDSE